MARMATDGVAAVEQVDASAVATLVEAVGDFAEGGGDTKTIGKEEFAQWIVARILRKGAATGSGFVQQTLAAIRYVPRDLLRFAGGSHKNLLMLSSMQDRNVHSVDISECLPDDKDAQFLTACRDARFEQVRDARRAIKSVGEARARALTRRFTVPEHSNVPFFRRAVR